MGSHFAAFHDPSDPAMVQGLQERAARASPAEHVERVGGWWLRRSTGTSWWVGTVLPHANPEPDGLDARVTEVERFYAAHGETAGFQITPLVCPPGLDSCLARRGYRHEGPMSLQVAQTAQVLGLASKTGPQVRLDDEPTGAWFQVWQAVREGDNDPRTDRDLLSRVARPSGYASAWTGSEVVAVGRAVADDGWAGVFGMATLPSARGRGAGRAVLAALADWADAHGERRLYLQVESHNLPALRLYGAMGFAEICRYHYRISGARPMSTGEAGQSTGRVQPWGSGRRATCVSRRA